MNNVGNVLNSINVAATLLEDQIRQSRSSDLNRLASLPGDHDKDIETFLAQDPQGKLVPVFVSKLAERLTAEQTKAMKELGTMRHNLEHLKNIVATQQSPR